VICCCVNCYKHVTSLRSGDLLLRYCYKHVTSLRSGDLLLRYCYKHTTSLRSGDLMLRLVPSIPAELHVYRKLVVQ